MCRFCLLTNFLSYLVKFFKKALIASLKYIEGEGEHIWKVELQFNFEIILNILTPIRRYNKLQCSNHLYGLYNYEFFSSYHFKGDGKMANSQTICFNFQDACDYIRKRANTAGYHAYREGLDIPVADFYVKGTRKM